jgi:hypothetical protein
MLPGEVPRDWRHRRIAVRATVNDDLPFVDIEAPPTRVYLELQLGVVMSSLGYTELDIPTIMTSDRRMTRWIAQWAWACTTPSGEPRFSGIRYLSRLWTGWECWGVFDRTPLVELERRPITLDMESLQTVLDWYNLTLY